MERPFTRVITRTRASTPRRLGRRAGWTCPSCLVSRRSGAAKNAHGGVTAFAGAGQRRFLADVIDAPVPPASLIMQRTAQRVRTSGVEVQSKTAPGTSPTRGESQAGTTDVEKRANGVGARNDGAKKWSTPLAKIIADAIEVRVFFTCLIMLRVWSIREYHSFWHRSKRAYCPRGDQHAFLNDTEWFKTVLRPALPG